MRRKTINSLLLDDYNLLVSYTEGRKIKKVLDLTETHITLLMEDDIIIQFSLLENEIIFDIKLPSS